jgi:hypothetical protein
MTTPAEVIRNNVRDNATRDAARQMGTFGEGQEELANGIPSGSNDAALATHLEEWRAKDVSYQRAQNQEARDQIEAAYIASQNRLNAAKQEIKDRANLEKYQQNQIDNSAGERLALQMEELVSTFPMDWRPETLPMDKLRQLTDLRHRVQTLAAATGQPGLADGVLESGPLSPANILGQLPNGPQVQPQAQPQAKAETFPDGSLYQLQNLPDGNVEVRLITGEVFKGDPITVTQQMAKAQVNTKRWAQAQRAQAQQSQQPAEPIQLNQQPQQPINSSEPAQQSTIADYWADQQAQAIGFSSKDEMLQWGQSITQFMAQQQQINEELANERLAAEFAARVPEFPGTPEASEALATIVQNNGWDWNVESLQAAHLLATNNHVYQPLTAEQIQIANGAAPPQQPRTTPPPMLRTNNPEISNAALNPYEMSLGDLRKVAIKQELDRNTPGYR